MDAAFTEEQHEIRRTLRELLHKRCGPDDLRAAVRTSEGHDRALWRQLAQQLGLPGLALPAAYGGVGCGPTELALACEETGRVLLPSPLLPTAALVAPLVQALGTERQRTELLPAFAAGGLTGALAVPGAQLGTALALTARNAGDWAGGGRAGGVQARRHGAEGEAEGEWRLYGEAAQVLDGHSAGLLLVAAHTGGYARGRTLLFVVRGDAPGVVRVRQTAMDETRPLGLVQLRDVSASLLGTEGGEVGQGVEDTEDTEGADGRVERALARVGAGAAAALAAEAVGAADAALARTVEYVRVREQFGRPIGSFQAVQHRLADLYVQVQAARSAAYYAAWAAGGPEGAAEPGTPGLALAHALETLRAVAGEAIQLHGGIGFTWEHDAHLFFKRAVCDELLLGPVHRLRAHAAGAAGLFEGGAMGVGVLA
ncbi:acyl-CoA dehydrogenase [Streptomyces sp. CB02923]|uniref:acyl-CoA dehydrogenase family protein n=1 Tax=Streptomyces sp. CB02923 TaxID=1718985 RepID=UPI00093C955C|nr:acyl-CoA dehydrogenase family protein [Streptomyces sp. CB02923]OKI03113.1 acyl-CoA dehydrogenase [Streptomyces sp. CB02923]